MTSYDPGMNLLWPVMTRYDKLLQVIGTSYYQYYQLVDPCKKMVTFRDYSASCNFFILEQFTSLHTYDTDNVSAPFHISFLAQLAKTLMPWNNDFKNLKFWVTKIVLGQKKN